MGWAVGYDSNWKRWVGYGVPAFCDHPDCDEKIDRGLSYVCGGEPFGGERGCGLFFCIKHMDYLNTCSKCDEGEEPFSAKPDHPEWVAHMLNDPSWETWRQENHSAVKEMQA